MNSKLFKLCLSAILALSFNACGGDDDNGGGGNSGGGGGNNTVKCTPGGIICSPDGNSELVCNAAGNGYDKGRSCDNGCVDNACSGSGGSGDNSSGCEDGSSSCNNNNVNAVDDEGDDCDSSRADRCDGTVISYCDPDDDVVVAGDCVDYYGKGAVCAIADGSANCYTPDQACTKKGAASKGCYDYYGYQLAVNYVCTETSAGLFNIMQEDYDICSGECSNGECVKVVDDEGEDCDSSRADRCDGTVISYCDPDYDVVVAGDCADYYGADAVCGVVAGSANCYKPEDACTTVNAETKGCYDYVTDDVTYRLAVTYVCTQTSAGKFNIMDPYDYDICSGGCVNGDCLKLVDDEGEKCNSSRADRCDGTVLSYCYENVVFAGDCVDYYGKGSVCGIVDGSANCYKSEDACTTVGSEKKGCYDYVSEYGTYKLAVKYVCTQTSAGKYYVMDGYDYDICDSSCRAGECVTLVEDEGDWCDSSRVDACNDGVLSYCNDPDGGTVEAIDCTEYDGYSCIILNDGYGNCFNASSECSKVGDFKYVCDSDGGYEISYVYKCVAAPNGKNYWEYHDYDWCNQTDVTAVCKASTGKCNK